MTVAFVLTGGGSLAATQVGMLRGLLEQGIVPDLVVGTSAGAINAVGFAQDPTHTGLDGLVEIWRRLRRRDVFPFGIGSLVAGLTRRADGLLSPARLRAVLTQLAHIDTLEEAKMPVHVVATDLRDGQPVVLSDGPVVPALLASAAMPGVFPPVGHHGVKLVDGGLAANAPVRQAEELGATVSYVLPSASADPQARPPRGALRVLLHVIEQLTTQTSTGDLQAARGEVRVLPAPALGAGSLFDFGHTEALLTAGYTAALNNLADDHTAAPAHPATRAATAPAAMRAAPGSSRGGDDHVRPDGFQPAEATG